MKIDLNARKHTFCAYFLFLHSLSKTCDFCWVLQQFEEGEMLQIQISDPTIGPVPPTSQRALPRWLWWSMWWTPYRENGPQWFNRPPLWRVMEYHHLNQKNRRWTSNFHQWFSLFWTIEVGFFFSLASVLPLNMRNSADFDIHYRFLKKESTLISFTRGWPQTPEAAITKDFSRTKSLAQWTGVITLPTQTMQLLRVNQYQNDHQFLVGGFNPSEKY